MWCESVNSIYLDRYKRSKAVAYLGMLGRSLPFTLLFKCLVLRSAFPVVSVFSVWFRHDFTMFTNRKRENALTRLTGWPGDACHGYMLKWVIC